MDVSVYEWSGASATANCAPTIIVDDTGPASLSPVCAAFVITDPSDPDNNSIMWGASPGPGATRPPAPTYAWALSTGETGTGALFISGPHPRGATISGQVTVTDIDGKTGTAVCPVQTIPNVTAPVCGNSNTETGETCDDGNTTSGDGCNSSCQIEVSSCGNGICEASQGETPFSCRADCKQKDIEEQ
jgi:cysteine-rich repeat protein